MWRKEGKWVRGVVGLLIGFGCWSGQGIAGASEQPAKEGWRDTDVLVNNGQLIEPQPILEVGLRYNKDRSPTLEVTHLAPPARVTRPFTRTMGRLCGRPTCDAQHSPRSRRRQAAAGPTGDSSSCARIGGGAHYAAPPHQER